MLDIKVIRENPEKVKASLTRRCKDYGAEVDRVLELDARRRENQKVLGALYRFKKYCNTKKQRANDKTHVYKKCPRCHSVLRLPRRKGKHTTVCPKCKNEFKVYVFKA